MSSALPDSPDSCIFYGWVVAAWLVVVKVMKCQGQNNVMSYTVPYLLQEFRLSNGELGALFSVATFSASSVQPSLGRCLDRFGARLCIPIAQVVLSLTLLCFSASQHVSQVVLVYLQVAVLFFFLRGLSLGALETFPGACIQKWFVQRRGRASTWVNALQQLGLAVMAPVISWLVANVGWRQTAWLGALVNASLAIPSVMILRSTPESFGLLPDGEPLGTVVTKGKVPDAKFEVAQVPASSSEGAPTSVLPRGLWQLYTFSFLFSFMFGGHDFEMVAMIREAGGEAGGVNVAMHIFFPMALIAALFGTIVGEVMDTCSAGPTLALFLLGGCGVVTCFMTNLLHYAGTPAVALSYGLLRGTTQAVYGPLLNAGLAFAAFGVHRSMIGRALGNNRFFVLAGTSCGPLVYGVTKDVLGSFGLGLQLSSIPILCLALHFWAAALSNQSCGAMRGYEKTRSDAREQEGDAEMQVVGKSLGQVGIACAASPGESISLQAPREDAEESCTLVTIPT